MCGEGAEFPIKELFPPEMQELRRQLVRMAQQALAKGKTATPYPTGTPLAAGIDPTALRGATLLNRMMGYGGYQPARPITYGQAINPPAEWTNPYFGFPIGGGGGGRPNPPNPPRPKPDYFDPYNPASWY